MVDQSPMETTDLISTTEAMAILKVRRSTVISWADKGRLKSIKMRGETGAYLFDRADVERLRDELAAAAS